jgi:hypothetical protein
MGSEHTYTSGVEKMLFVLSRGYCYAPTCNNPVVRFDANDKPEVTVFIAHIHAARRHGPRWKEDMEPEERKSFGNLLLLCKNHHMIVDSKQHEKRFPASVLKKWKERREKALASQIKGLAFLTEDQLVSHLGKAAADSRDKVLREIDRVHGLTAEVVSLLKVIVDEPYRRPVVDPDDLASLERSAGMLSFLQDHTPVLAQSAQAISQLADYSGPLMNFARAVEQMPDLSTIGNVEYVSAVLGSEAGRIDEAAVRVHTAVDRLQEAAQSVDIASQVPPSPYAGPAPPKSWLDSDVDEIATGDPGHNNVAAGKHSTTRDLGWISRIPVQFRWGLGVGVTMILLIQLVGILFFK